MAAVLRGLRWQHAAWAWQECAISLVGLLYTSVALDACHMLQLKLWTTALPHSSCSLAARCALRLRVLRMGGRRPRQSRISYDDALSSQTVRRR
ncbi:hypothetical protein CC85DRAFT_285762 [Cutaneotrichosporon oleaginosum]|uniref:Uncharacterized protein n=1 Tax=Cutaneotrichosporon oleaginosum TaxID=879819 RepID=A0A0J0XM32_9TREE|nr:uncharacterized protein CC85DRAFT_285762 [Cutaneotrichosporon oleaginosum]KLT42170.1 hypothetical protein CC85DRAFT_285762 [Cutaneotrichosporon oleaginosum]TXT11707.1 hypothetical protein COLE_02117 [Cutaneotrichosporon oleaginosum]